MQMECIWNFPLLSANSMCKLQIPFGQLSKNGFNNLTFCTIAGNISEINEVAVLHILNLNFISDCLNQVPIFTSNEKVMYVENLIGLNTKHVEFILKVKLAKHE